MVFQSILLSFLISFFNGASTRTLESIRGWVSPINAQVNKEVAEEEIELVEEKEDISLTDILVNNQRVELNEQKEIFVVKDDAVRVSGYAIPNTSITIYFGDMEKSTIANKDGFWFVLFSITDIEENQYILTAKNNDSEEGSVPLFTLVVGDGTELVEPLLDSSINNITNFFESLPIYLLLLILIPLAIVLGWILGVSFSKKNRKEITDQKDKKN